MKNFILRTNSDNLAFIINLLFQSIGTQYIVFKCAAMGGDYSEIIHEIVKYNKTDKVAYIFEEIQALNREQWAVITAEIIREKKTIIIIAKENDNIPPTVEVRCVTLSLKS